MNTSAATSGQPHAMWLYPVAHSTPAKLPDHARPNTICAIKNAAQSLRMLVGSRVADSSQL
ncbi:hypothetical protein D3C72_2363820 [compost metagenome]